MFVIHGRDEALRERIFEVLRALDLRPLEWETLVSATRHTSPSLLTVVETALEAAQAVLVLLTPDDIVRLHPDLCRPGDVMGEAGPMMQPRPNVLIELGMAWARSQSRTIIIEVGKLRPVADLGGLNVLEFDGTAVALGKLVQRLKLAGCPVDDSGADWRSARRFAALASFARMPVDPAA